MTTLKKIWSGFLKALPYLLFFTAVYLIVGLGVMGVNSLRNDSTPPVATGESSAPDMTHMEIVGRLHGTSMVVYVLKLPDTDGLYLQTSSYYNLVPYTHPDGTMVTYDEYMANRAAEGSS